MRLNQGSPPASDIGEVGSPDRSIAEFSQGSPGTPPLASPGPTQPGDNLTPALTPIKAEQEQEPASGKPAAAGLTAAGLAAAATGAAAAVGAGIVASKKPAETAASATGAPSLGAAAGVAAPTDISDAPEKSAAAAAAGTVGAADGSAGGLSGVPRPSLETESGKLKGILKTGTKPRPEALELESTKVRKCFWKGVSLQEWKTRLHSCWKLDWFRCRSCFLVSAWMVLS